MTTAPLEVSDVAKTLAGHTVLAGVRFDVPAGSVTALVGPNGAGKTTCVSIATGLRRADRGTVTISGTPADDPRARSLVSVVPQDVGFPAAVSAGHCLRFVAGQRADQGRTPSVGELVERLELAAVLGRRTGALSGGQHRKLAIALALVHAPALVILDEATTNLDERARATTWALIRDYAACGGAVLVTSHILADIDAHADRVVALDRGRVALADDLDAIRHRLGGSVVSVRLSPGMRAAVAERVGVLRLGESAPDGGAGTRSRWLSHDPLRLLAVIAEADPQADEVLVRPVSLRDVLDALPGTQHPVTASGGGRPW